MAPGSAPVGTVLRNSVLCTLPPPHPPSPEPPGTPSPPSAVQPARVSLQDLEVPGGQEEVQGDLASLRCQGCHRAVLGRPPGHAGQNQEPADAVSCPQGGGGLRAPLGLLPLAMPSRSDAGPLRWVGRVPGACPHPLWSHMSSGPLGVMGCVPSLPASVDQIMGRGTLTADKKTREKGEKPVLETELVDELSMMGRVVKVERQVRRGQPPGSTSPSLRCLRDGEPGSPGPLPVGRDPLSPGCPCRCSP